MSGRVVKTEGRFVQWEVGCLDCCKQSTPFMVGIWKWYCPDFLFSTLQNSVNLDEAVLTNKFCFFFNVFSFAIAKASGTPF